MEVAEGFLNMGSGYGQYTFHGGMGQHTMYILWVSVHVYVHLHVRCNTAYMYSVVMDYNI